MKTRAQNLTAILINLFIVVSELVMIIKRMQSADVLAFSYYTILSNLMAMAAGIIFLIHAFSGSERLKYARTMLRYYATCMLAFTFIIVISVLTPMCFYARLDPSFLYLENAALFLHVINPALSFVSFVFLEDNSTLKKDHPAFMLLISFCYTVVLIILNILRIVDGPYPFFQVYNNPVWATILWIVGLAGFDYLINYLIYRVGTRRKK